MTNELIASLCAILREEAELLETWADDALNGGWSTQQVEPMRKRAVQLRSIARVNERIAGKDGAP